MFKYLISNLKNDYSIYCLNKKIKKCWKNNAVFLKNYVNLKDLEFGSHSYGRIYVLSSHSESVLRIGNFCSIGPNCTFVLNSEHNYKFFTTYPLEILSNEKLSKSSSKGDIVIGDDVWIGCNVTILSGVNIAQGAVVASCAVVTKNVPPYAIVAGVPAKVIKYRFSEEIVEELKKINYKTLNVEKMRALSDFGDIDCLEKAILLRKDLEDIK